MSEPTTAPAFAVIDPGTAAGRRLIAALGTDAIELDSPRLRGEVERPFVIVAHRKLAPGPLVRLCRELAVDLELSEAGTFFEAVHGYGLPIYADLCYLCQDPALGREFFAGRARSGEGGGPC